MKNGLLTTLGLIVLGVIVFGIGAATAQTTANGPYYATPSWDQQLPASTRFIVLSNWIDSSFPSGGAAVLDRETGLVWERSPSTSRFPWQDLTFGNTAAAHCNSVSAGNRLGWHLPTLQELASLVDQSGPSKLPVGHPFQNVGGNYWSATSNADNPANAWIVSFNFGIVGNSNKTNEIGAWCVRGGRGAEDQ